MRTDMNLRGLRVAVTGGTSGLGLALVRRLVARRRSALPSSPEPPRAVERIADETGACGIVGDVGRKEDIYPVALQVTGNLGGLDALINSASTLGPTPLVPLADTECEDLEQALVVNVLGPFRLTKALFGALAASAREGRGAVVINISSDAAVNAYSGWGAYGSSKAALHHLTAIWAEEAKAEGISFLSLDPGDMDTPLHALAVPDGDPSTLRRPEDAAAEIVDALLAALPGQADPRSRCSHDRSVPTGDPPDSSPSMPMAGCNICHALCSRPSSAPATCSSQMMRQRCRRAFRASMARAASRSRFGLRRGCRSTTRRASPRSHSAPAIIAHAPKSECCRRHFRRATGSRLARLLRSSSVLDDPRLFQLRFLGDRATVIAGLARHGRPIQYAHVPEPLALWDVWTRIAADPVAFEPPSAGFALDWHTRAVWRRRGIDFATLTHAAGISSTGHPGSTCASRSTSPIGFLNTLRQRSSAQSRKTGASLPSGRPSSARSSRRRTLTAACGAGTGSRAGALDVKRHSASRMRS